MESPSHSATLRSARPAARASRLTSSFKPVSEAARASGITTPTGILLGRASDIITSGLDRGVNAPQSTWESENEPMWLTSSTDRKLKSCLSLGRNADSLTPLASAAVVHLAEHKGLHWKPELVAVSAADHRSDSRELQARYRKLETDLQESEAARTMLQKQLHRVQDAMKQNRTHLEDAQRSALAAEEKAAAAEAKAASLSAEACIKTCVRSLYAAMQCALLCLAVTGTHQLLTSLQVKNLQAELAEARTRLHQEAIDKVCRQA